LSEGWGVYIAVVFEDGGFGKFECDSSLEGGKLFVVKIFLVFSSGGMKDLSVSVTFCRINALNEFSYLIYYSVRQNQWLILRKNWMFRRDWFNWGSFRLRFSFVILFFWEVYCWFSIGSVKRSVLKVDRRRTGFKQLKITI
jgi:hypothetical protein